MDFLRVLACYILLQGSLECLDKEGGETMQFYIPQFWIGFGASVVVTYLTLIAIGIWMNKKKAASNGSTNSDSADKGSERE